MRPSPHGRQKRRDSHIRAEALAALKIDYLKTVEVSPTASPTASSLGGGPPTCHPYPSSPPPPLSKTPSSSSPPGPPQPHSEGLRHYCRRLGQRLEHSAAADLSLPVALSMGDSPAVHTLVPFPQGPPETSSTPPFPPALLPNSH
eukprot:EG_transcript_27396